MEQVIKKTASDTRIIANFMGWVDSPIPHLSDRVYAADLSEVKSLDHFAYRDSWDELMPVVKKIQQLSIEDFGKKKPVMNALMDVELESLFAAVVAFVKWYNSSIALSENS